MLALTTKTVSIYSIPLFDPLLSLSFPSSHQIFFLGPHLLSQLDIFLLFTSTSTRRLTSSPSISLSTIRPSLFLHSELLLVSKYQNTDRHPSSQQSELALTAPEWFPSWCAGQFLTFYSFLWLMVVYQLEKEKRERRWIREMRAKSQRIRMNFKRTNERKNEKKKRRRGTAWEERNRFVSNIPMTFFSQILTSSLSLFHLLCFLGWMMMQGADWRIGDRTGHHQDWKGQ